MTIHFFPPLHNGILEAARKNNASGISFPRTSGEEIVPENRPRNTDTANIIP